MKKFGVLLVATMLLLTACGSGSSSSSSSASATLEAVPAEYAGKSNPFDASAATAGAEVFKTNCVACHGEQGKGDGIASGSLDPKPANLGELVKHASDDYLFWRITEGRPGTSMVAWKGILTEEQIWQVISFIHTLNQ